MRDVAPIHADAKRVIAILAELESASPAPTTVQGMRAFASRRAARMQAAPPDVGRVLNLSVPGPAHTVPVRLYFPVDQDGGPRPAFIYAHGGGFVVGDLDMVDTACRTICRDAGIAVVSIDYRLAPEHPFPAGLEDVLTVARWVVRDGACFGIDPNRLAIGGDSAGGNLAAAAAQALAGDPDVTFRHQVLVYPVTDLTCSQPSYGDLGVGYPLTAERMRAYIKHYLADPTLALDVRASPLLAKSVVGLPPALVVLAGLDPLVDEGAAYARRLAGAGVPSEVVVVPDHPHGFLGWTREAEAARVTLALIAKRLRWHLTG